MNAAEALNEVVRLNPNAISAAAINSNPNPWIETEFRVFFENSPAFHKYELIDGQLWYRGPVYPNGLRMGRNRA